MATFRLKDEIFAALAARWTAQSPVRDPVQSAVSLSLLGVIADEFAAIEYRAKSIRDAWWFEGANGDLLVERAREIGVTPLTGSAASGACMQFTRDSALGTLSVGSGLVCTRPDEPSVQYVSEEAFQFQIGQTVYPDESLGQTPVRVTANVRGEIGNAPPGAIQRVKGAPSSIIKAVSIESISGGTDAESQDDLKRRCKLKLASLSATQATAQVYAALSFQPSNGIRFRHAKAFEVPSRASYTELVVDDGNGLVGYAKKGTITSGVVPINDPLLIQTVLYHEAPATEPISASQFKINGAPAPVNADGTPRWVSIPERGLLYPDPGLLVAGDTWEISAYNVYTGPIRELQAELEGDLSNPTESPGWRPAGGRVRALPPTPWPIPSLVVNIVVFKGVDLGALRTRVVKEIVALVQSLAPGEPLFEAVLLARLIALPGMRNVTLVTPAGDTYPPNIRYKLTLAASSIQVV